MDNEIKDGEIIDGKKVLDNALDDLRSEVEGIIKDTIEEGQLTQPALHVHKFFSLLS